MTRPRHVTLLMLLCAGVAASAPARAIAQTPPAIAQTPPATLTLAEAVRLALDHNSRVRESIESTEQASLARHGWRRRWDSAVVDGRTRGGMDG